MLHFHFHLQHIKFSRHIKQGEEEDVRMGGENRADEWWGADIRSSTT
jgi:hypothetical protein